MRQAADAELDFLVAKSAKIPLSSTAEAVRTPGLRKASGACFQHRKVAGFVGPTGAGGGPTIMARAALRLIVIVFELLADDQEPVGL
jgi:hypothetical protein